MGLEECTAEKPAAGWALRVIFLEPRPMSTPSARPAPAAQGTLDKRPLVHLLVYALERRLTGTMEFHAPEGVATLVFEDGCPAKGRVASEPAHGARDLSAML